MANWRLKFSKPIYLTDGTVMNTLSDARKWLLTMASNQNEYQNAAGAILSAAEGGDLDKAREALSNAAFLNQKLDLTKK